MSASIANDSPQGSSSNEAAAHGKNSHGVGAITSYPEDVPRESFTAMGMIREIWTGLELPAEALDALVLPGAHENPAVPSSYKIGILAQGAIALSALAAAQVHQLRNGLTATPRVEVPLVHATAEFRSERLYTLDGRKPTPSGQGSSVGGLHKTSDGYVRVHDGFPNHALGILDLVGLPHDATRRDLADKLASWASIDLENVATAEGKLAVYALRSYAQWDCLPQSRAISNFPIDVNPVVLASDTAAREASTGMPRWMPSGNAQCLQGLRVVELSRVIAAPVCGKTLAAHGADVIWVTSPRLPALPYLDREFARGKRTVQLDLADAADKARLLDLLRTADVLVQGFRPGALAAYGLDPETLARANPGLVVANLSAFGPRGPWAGRRGFDSLVQTCAGFNVSEAAHAGQGETARPMPCQALDHAAGFLLATGVMAAVYRRAVAPRLGPWRVDVSLASVMKYLRSLGQYPGTSGFEVSADDVGTPDDDRFEVRETAFGVLRALRHSANIEDVRVGWDVMPKPLGSDAAEWL